MMNTFHVIGTVLNSLYSLTHLILMIIHTNLTRKTGIMSTILQEGKQRYREVKSVGQCFRSSKWQS